MASLSFTSNREVNYYYIDNPDQLKTLKGLLEKHQQIIPPWITRISVQLVAIDAALLAEVATDSHYLKAKISVGESFFSNTPAVMESVFVHELFHMPVSELSDWLYDMAEAADIDPKTLAFLEKERMIRNERLTEFLCQMYMRKHDIQIQAQF